MKADALDRSVAEANYGAVNTAHCIGPDAQDKGTVLVVEDQQSIGLPLRFILFSFRLVFSRLNR